MKKFSLIFTISLFTLFTACDKENLDLNPFGSVGADVALVTPTDFQAAVNGLYTMMITDPVGNPFFNGGSYGASFMSFPDVISDNLIYNPGGRGTQKTQFDFQYNANNTYQGFMTECYAVIQHANFILENIDKLEDGSLKNNVIAQCKAARALALFTVNNVFAKIPTQSGDANGSLGMPIVTNSAIRQLPSRNTVAEVYTSVITDLEDAKALIDPSNGKERFNLDAINGLLSRVYLYNGQNQQAVTAANAVTTSVATFSNFAGVWTDANNDGVIFELKNFDTDTNVSVGVPYSQTLTGGIKSEYVLDFGFFNQFQNTDIRKSAYVVTSSFEGNVYNHVAKYLSSSVNTGSGVVDVKVIRAAEVQLNKAEALANMGGQDAAALAALDLVRAQRYSGFTPGAETGQALKDAIQLERRLELAFEGHRFFDIKRRGMSISRTAAGQFADGTGTLPIALTLPAGDYRFQLPIPKTELDVNPNMVQNPNY
ncbi:MAG: RagB/SusD family nutrient uptake outer membrane protein [Gelidibacter sp.]